MCVCVWKVRSRSHSFDLWLTFKRYILKPVFVHSIFFKRCRVPDLKARLDMTMCECSLIHLQEITTAALPQSKQKVRLCVCDPSSYTGFCGNQSRRVDVNMALRSLGRTTCHKGSGLLLVPLAPSHGDNFKIQPLPSPQTMNSLYHFMLKCVHVREEWRYACQS